MNHVDQLVQSALDEVENCLNIKEVELVRVKYLGKSGLITSELKNLSKLEIEEKKKLVKH